VGPTCQPLFPPLSFLLPCPAGRRRSRGFRRAPPLPLPFFPPRACQLSQVTALDQLGPFPLSLHRAVMAAAINGRRRRSGPPISRRLPSAGPILARARTPWLPFRLCNAHAHEPELNFNSTAASVPAAAVDSSPPVKG
jgi:hypothetical protein